MATAMLHSYPGGRNLHTLMPERDYNDMATVIVRADSIAFVHNYPGSRDRVSERRLVRAMGRAFLRYARRFCPVDTGRLQRSLELIVSGYSITIVSSLDYFEYVQRHRPFIARALGRLRGTWRSLVQRFLG